VVSFCFVYLVDLVRLVSPISLIQPNKQDKPKKPIEQEMLADCFQRSAYTTGNSDSPLQYAAAHRLSFRSAG
jgi:hypothetical protein